MSVTYKDISDQFQHVSLNDKGMYDNIGGGNSKKNTNVINKDMFLATIQTKEKMQKGRGRPAKKNKPTKITKYTRQSDLSALDIIEQISKNPKRGGALQYRKSAGKPQIDDMSVAYSLMKHFGMSLFPGTYSVMPTTDVLLPSARQFIPQQIFDDVMISGESKYDKQFPSIIEKEQNQFDEKPEQYVHYDPSSNDFSSISFDDDKKQKQEFMLHELSALKQHGQQVPIIPMMPNIYTTKYNLVNLIP
jgi:hypothetical protein